MALTTYEGKLTPTKRWPEAIEDFSNKDVQEHLFTALQELAFGKACLKRTNHRGVAEIWIQSNTGWVRISENGEIELGESAA